MGLSGCAAGEGAVGAAGGGAAAPYPLGSVRRALNPPRPREELPREELPREELPREDALPLWL
jgi:hypothetical protein